MYFKTHPDYNFRPFVIPGGVHDKNPCIVRISPNNGRIEFEWIDLLNRENDKCTVFYSYDTFNFEFFEADGNKVIFNVIANRDIAFYIQTADGRKSTLRLVNTGEFPGTVINYLNPGDKQYGCLGRFLASPSVVRLDNGDLLASMDVFALKHAMNTSIICRSHDDGESWEYLTDLYPSFWTTLFVKDGKVFAISLSAEYGDLQVLESLDNGESWHGIVLARGVGPALVGYHRAPTPVVVHKGRIWFSMEYGSWDVGKFMPMVWSIDENADLMDINNWKCSEFFDCDQSLEGMEPDRKGAVIEGTLVVNDKGELLNILRHGKHKAVVLKVDDENFESALSYVGAIDFDIGFSKFYIQKYNGVYYAVGNRSPYRNELLLYTSSDCLNWTYSKTLLDYKHEPAARVGIQYPTFFIENGVIYLALRTAMNGAENFHDSNAITFHKFEI